MGGGHMRMYRLHHLFVLMRPGDSQNAGVALADRGLVDTHAAGDDHAPVPGHGFADGLEAFRLGAVQEAAGIDDHGIGVGIFGREFIALRPQRGDDSFRIHQGLGTPQGNNADLRRGGAAA